MKYETVNCVEAIIRLTKNNETIMLSPDQYDALLIIFGAEELEESIAYFEKNIK